MPLIVRPISVRAANNAVAMWHRHNRPVSVARFAIAAYRADDVAGLPEAIAIVGNPVARHLADATTAEVLRVCAAPAAKTGACSMLLAASWRAWRAMGGRRLVTYTLAGESGASLRALKQQGWRLDKEVRPRKPGARTHRPGRRALPVESEHKLRWCVETTPAKRGTDSAPPPATPT